MTLKRIAFVGSHGTGKTTLLNSVKDKLMQKGHKVACVEELARLSPFPINQNTLFNSEFFIMSNQINYENIIELEQPEYVLMDRSVLDSLVYWDSISKKRSMKEEENKILRSMCENWINAKETTYVYVTTDPEEWKTRNLDDGVRDTNPEWFREIQESFEDHLKQKKLNYFKVKNNKPEDLERTTQAILESIK